MRIGQQRSGHGLGASPSAPDSVLAPEPTGIRAWLSVPLAYIALTKPRVIELLLVATIPTMLLADRGHVDIRLIGATLFGGSIGAASANTLNCVVDADIDKKM